MAENAAAQPRTEMARCP